MTGNFPFADLTLASQREPENGSVKEEIKKVNELIAKRKPIKVRLGVI